MKPTIHRVILFFLLAAATLFAEPSVYRYGESSSTKKTVTNNKKLILQLKRKIAKQSERIEGLSSIVEGLIASRPSSKKDVKSCDPDIVRRNSELIRDLSKRVNEMAKSHAEQSRSTKTSLFKPKEKEEKKVDLSKLSSSKLFKDGVRLFSKGRYDEAKKRFDLTDTKGHKSAASNYYLGEIAYYTKKYDDAIFYFKKSAGLYDRASYIDTLLLHTAISLEKNGQKKQAKSFYENIITNYKHKKSAKIAKEKLKKF